MSVTEVGRSVYILKQNVTECHSHNLKLNLFDACLVFDVRTGQSTDLTSIPISIENAGVQCGGRSKLNRYRNENVDLSIPCSTSDDVCALLQKSELGAPCRSQCLFIENVTEFAGDGDGEDGATAGFETEFRMGMAQRGYAGTSRLLDSLAYGGVQDRKRYASVDIDIAQHIPLPPGQRPAPGAGVFVVQLVQDHQGTK